MKRKKSDDERREGANAAEVEHPTVVLHKEALTAGAAPTSGGWDDADDLPGGGAQTPAPGAASTGSLSFQTEAIGDVDDEIPVVVASGDMEAEAMTSALETSSSFLTEGIPGAAEAAEEVGLLDRNPGFTDTASATESVAASSAPDVSLDDITEDLGGPMPETAKGAGPAAARAPAPLVLEEAPRSRNRLLVYGGVTALAAAIVAAVVLWPQWGPLVLGGKSAPAAYGDVKQPVKPAATVAAKTDKPAAGVEARAPVVTPATAPAATVAVTPAAASASAAKVVEASYRGSWDSVIALSLGTSASTSATDKPDAKGTR